MKKELEIQLVKKYPIIFKQYGGDIRETCMGWGVECGEGWYNILNKLCEEITKIQTKYKFNVIADQIKEKFGGLRFYFHIENYKPHLLERIEDKIAHLFYKYLKGKEFNIYKDYRRRAFMFPAEKIEYAIEKAEIASFRTCERCGAPGKERGGRWRSVLCDRCERKYMKGKNDAN